MDDLITQSLLVKCAAINTECEAMKADNLTRLSNNESAAWTYDDFMNLADALYVIAEEIRGRAG